MQERLKRIVEGAWERAGRGGLLKVSEEEISIFRPSREEMGDFTTNFPFIVAKGEGIPPGEVARILVERMEDPEGLLDRVEATRNGFINFSLKRRVWHESLRAVLMAGEAYGRGDGMKGKRVNVEFVSANPTGPLHMGHGRGAIVGTALSNILKECGCEVTREYYINDTGSQIENLGESVYRRLMELAGEEREGLTLHYEGEYLISVAERWMKEGGGRRFEEKGEGVRRGGEFAVSLLLEGIKRDLSDFGIEFDEWVSEKELYERGIIDSALSILKRKGMTYTKDGAVWFKSSELGDEKDRVLIREDGRPTYLASDVGYHLYKIERGYDVIVNIWGADHHGYVARMKGVVDLLMPPPREFKTILVQMVHLTRGGVTIPMAKRSGDFVSLRSVFEEVGLDAAKFFFLLRSSDSHLDFDLDLARKESNENPVYLTQYAHARICGVIREAEKRGIRIPEDPAVIDLSPLKEMAEIGIIRTLHTFPEILLRSAEQYEPHPLVFYLLDLSKRFNSYYNIGSKRHRILSDDVPLTRARLALAQAVRQVLKKGLGLLTVSAPVKM